MRAGRWHDNNNAALSTVYLGSVTSSVGLVLAGFANNPQLHVQPRGCLEPPQNLQRKIFPWLDSKLQEVDQVKITIRCP